MSEVKKSLLDLHITIEDLIKSEFKNSKDLQLALEIINDAIEDFDDAIEREIDKVSERVETKRILKEEIKDLPFISSLDDKYKDLVVNLSIKYDKNLPDDGEFRERIFRRIVDLSDDTIINLAYGKSTIEAIGKSISGSNNYELGLKALKKDSFLPRNIESTYGKAIDNIYKHNGLFLSFLIDYFRS